MRVVMFHSGKEFPTFLEDNFRQFRYFNPNTPVYFLTDYGHLDNPIFAKYGIISVNKDDYYCERVTEFERLFGRSSDDFWTLAATRLIYIENFMRLRQLLNVYHFENDVLIYYDLNEYHQYIKKNYQIGMTIGGPDKCMTGFAFFKDYKALQHMNTYFLTLLFEYGVKGVLQKFRMDMVNEMTLMRVYASDADSKLRPFPTMPVPPMNYKLDDFGSLFDPASWGQYVGGTRSEGPGATPQDHYVGVWIKGMPEVRLTWIYQDHLRIPCLIYGDMGYRINNLHIHSKNLHLYTSK